MLVTKAAIERMVMELIAIGVKPKCVAVHPTTFNELLRAEWEKERIQEGEPQQGCWIELQLILDPECPPGQVYIRPETPEPEIEPEDWEKP